MPSPAATGGRDASSSLPAIGSEPAIGVLQRRHSTLLRPRGARANHFAAVASATNSLSQRTTPCSVPHATAKAATEQISIPTMAARESAEVPFSATAAAAPVPAAARVSRLSLQRLRLPPAAATSPLLVEKPPCTMQAGLIYSQQRGLKQSEDHQQPPDSKRPRTQVDFTNEAAHVMKRI